MFDSGSFSVVKDATNKENKKKYAVKIIEKENMDRDKKEMVDNEINCWRKLDHPHCNTSISYRLF